MTGGRHHHQAFLSQSVIIQSVFLLNVFLIRSHQTAQTAHYALLSCLVWTVSFERVFLRLIFLRQVFLTVIFLREAYLKTGIFIVTTIVVFLFGVAWL